MSPEEERKHNEDQEALRKRGEIMGRVRQIEEFLRRIGYQESSIGVSPLSLQAIVNGTYENNDWLGREWAPPDGKYGRPVLIKKPRSWYIQSVGADMKVWDRRIDEMWAAAREAKGIQDVGDVFDYCT